MTYFWYIALYYLSIDVYIIFLTFYLNYLYMSQICDWPSYIFFIIVELTSYTGCPKKSGTADFQYLAS